MPSITRDQVRVPADVPAEARDTYIDNYLEGDARHRPAHAVRVRPEDRAPERRLLRRGHRARRRRARAPVPHRLAGRRAACSPASAVSSPQYAADYPDINYLVKMNSKTHLVEDRKHQDDPYTPQLYDLADRARPARQRRERRRRRLHDLPRLASTSRTMMTEAGQLIADAHAEGLLVVLWMYPRGKAVADEKDAHLIAGAAGVALLPGRGLREGQPAQGRRRELLGREAQGGVLGRRAAPVSCAPAARPSTRRRSSASSGTRSTWAAPSGNATGRNIHQRSLDEAVRLTKAISAITLGDYGVDRAVAVFNGEKDFTRLADALRSRRGIAAPPRHRAVPRAAPSRTADGAARASDTTRRTDVDQPTGSRRARAAATPSRRAAGAPRRDVPDGVWVEVRRVQAHRLPGRARRERSGLPALRRTTST